LVVRLCTWLVVSAWIWALVRPRSTAVALRRANLRGRQAVLHLAGRQPP